MIMTKLYPIGTQLITHRLSQAALFVDVFPESSTEFASFFDPDDEVGVRHLVGFCLSADEWRVMVTEDNQKWLSPVPMVGDLVDVDKRYSVPTIIYVSKYDVGLLDNPSAVVKRIIERTYPNGQRAPLIEWDEVILPTGQTPNTHPAP
jgi:hypothetical protein